MLFKRHYYYEVAGLPDLFLDENRAKVSVAHFRDEFRQMLHPDDYALVEVLFLKYDNKNLLNLLLKNDKPWQELANYSRDLLEEEIRESDDRIPAYMRQFIEKFKSGERDDHNKPWEAVLDAYFYEYLQSLDNDFLREYYGFLLDFTNLTTALALREHELPPTNQLIGDNLVTQSIMRSSARDFGVTQDFAEAEKIITAWQSDTITAREKNLDLIKWQWIDEHTFFEYFTIERLLAFMLQLEIAERWLRLDPETGRSMFDQLLDRLTRDYKLPDEFNLQQIKRS
jgi:vacuolar-type H+-ATPase subunit C/Vma6